MKCLIVRIVTDIFTNVLQELPHLDINACKSDIFQTEMVALVSSFVLFIRKCDVVFQCIVIFNLFPDQRLQK